MQTLLRLLTTTYRAIESAILHDGIEHAGYLGFLGLLSFFPFLVILFALAGVIGEWEVGVRFVQLVLPQLPPHVAEALKPRIQEIISGPPQGLMTLAIIGALWTASSTVEGLRTILNRAYRVTTPPPYLLRRILSIGQLVVVTFLVILAMLILVFWPLLLQLVQSWLPFAPITHPLRTLLDPVWTYLQFGFTFVLLFLMVRAIYHIVPNTRLCRAETWPGALLTVLGWMGGAALFSGYLSHFQQVNILYGSLGGIIAALLFFYIMALILIVGAEFNYLWKQSGEGVQSC
jgi:membrane protein